MPEKLPDIFSTETPLEVDLPFCVLAEGELSVVAV